LIVGFLIAAPLINEMKVNMEYLWKLKRKMSGKDIDIKLHMLEDERGKINAACTSSAQCCSVVFGAFQAQWWSTCRHGP
jgi:hypothetical protein